MIDIKGIEAVIPHRGDMRMVDEIREYTETSGVGIKYVRPDEFWCAGHFPGNPIMPGVLQIEALAQTACFIVFKQLGTTGKDTLGYFTTMERIKFSHMVKPGDTLELHVEVIAKKMTMYKFRGIALVGGKKVSEATFTAIMN
ncbi:MAG: 3-hydroxyacyl-ACP dehydratase FabZ [Alphaproteobacteria bacterium]|jgi:3-hydroxyacyl-[acyl-carrier-protein] dehydratase|nr:3-hydroxyacyl-ACP dehydratase FabZ [Alphaproteobacteria bacterium]